MASFIPEGHSAMLIAFLIRSHLPSFQEVGKIFFFQKERVTQNSCCCCLSYQLPLRLRGYGCYGTEAALTRVQVVSVLSASVLSARHHLGPQALD